MSTNIVNNRYIISGLLGEGGTGVVYLAEDILKNNKKLALKWVNDSILRKTALQLLKKEYDIMTRLKHPNLIRVYSFEFNESRKKHFITMEFLPGISIQEHINTNGPIEIPQAISYLTQLCRALNFIHSRNIIHRDIKPNNIFINGNIIKIMDFGLSDHSHESGTLKGTLSYMAPELFEGICDNRADIFALGVTFYQMIIGSSIYEDVTTRNIIPLLRDMKEYSDNVLAIINQIKDKKIVTLLKKMLQFYPNQRYQTCSQVITDINKYFDHNHPIETKKTKNAYVLGPGFIGRKKELQRLINMINTKKSNVICIQGEPGIGKSRIMYEFEKHCQLHEKYFYKGNCQEEYKRILDPFTPIVEELLLKAPHDLITEYGEELKKILPENKNLKTFQELPIQDPEVEREIITKSIIGFITDYTNHTKNDLIIYINDIQWADDITLYVIESLITKIYNEKDNHRLHFLLTCRKDPDIKITKALTSLNVPIMPLSIFDESDTHNYFTSIFGPTKIGKNLKLSIPVIRKKVGGNPFFLQELIKSLIDSDTIVHTDKSWELTKSIHDVYIPEDLKLLINKRLQNLNLLPEELLILQIIALLDRGISNEELSFIIPTPETFLQDLAHMEFLIQEYTGHDIIYYPAHDLIRSVLLQKITYKENLHSLIARKLELYHEEDLDNNIDELAHHFFHAKNRDKAKFYLEKSGAKRLQNHDIPEAIICYNRLVTLISNDKEKLMIYFRLNYIYTLIISDYTRGRKTLDKIKTIVDKLDDPTLKAKYYIKEGTYCRKAIRDYKNAIQYYNKAIEIFKELNDIRGVADGYYLLAIHYSHNEPNFKKALDFHRISLDYSQKYNLQELTASNKGNIGTIHLLTGNFDEAVSYIKSTEAEIIKGGNKRNLAVLYGQLGHTYLAKKEYDLARENFNNAIKYCEEMSSPWLTLDYLEGKINLLLAEQNYSMALNEIEKGQKLANEFPDNYYLLRYNILMAEINILQNNIDKALLILTKSLDVCKDELIKAEIYYKLWKLDSNSYYKQQSLFIYETKKIDALNYMDKKRLHELRTQ